MGIQGQDSIITVLIVKSQSVQIGLLNWIFCSSKMPSCFNICGSKLSSMLLVTFPSWASEVKKKNKVLSRTGLFLYPKAALCFVREMRQSREGVSDRGWVIILTYHQRTVYPNYCLPQFPFLCNWEVMSFCPSSIVVNWLTFAKKNAFNILDIGKTLFRESWLS